MIELKHIIKKYGERTVLNDVSFKVEKGEVLGFLGPNGAGKTTTMRIITGYLSPTQGDVIVNGFDIKKNPLNVKAAIGYLPELAPAYPEMTVINYLQFMAGIKGLYGDKLNSAIDRVLVQTSLTRVSNRIIGNLSRGYKQRVGIAQALLTDPPILILDEPTVGLDPEQIIEIRNLIKELGKDHTIILSTHILPEVTVTCNRVIIINDGRLLTNGNYELSFGNIQGDKSYKLIVTRPDDNIPQLLKTIQGVKDINKENETFTIKVNSDFNAPESITEKVFKAGYGIIEFSQKTINLEEEYIRLISQDRGGIQ
ncbi:MAG: ABC transporter ATP-binding protein [bacterium]